MNQYIEHDEPAQLRAPSRSGGAGSEAVALLWTLKKVARQLDVSVRTVRRLIEHGDLPVVRVGRLIRIPSSALHNWIAQNSVTAHNQNCVEPEAWKGIKPCYTNAQTRNFGGSVLPMQAAKELGVLLALPIEKKRKR